MTESPLPKTRTLDRLVGDVTAAAISATLASPAIVLIDRAVVATTASGDSVLRSLWTQTAHAASRPKSFFSGRPFAIIWTLYAATYTVASFSDTLAGEYYAAAASTITFQATTAINVPLGTWKDIRFAQIFSHRHTADTISHEASRAPTVASSKLSLASSLTSSVPTSSPRRMPRAVAGVFLARDAITLFGSFTLAPRVATYIPDSLVLNVHAKAAISQVLTQLMATPVHGGVTFSNRLAHIGLGLGGTTFTRCLRILPAFGFGVLANQELRSSFHTVARAT
ncbi:hypothetical protein F4824DRAFT_492419 [Ustulina deusta]|nr:hypothetical protein F4824DRAFT_492419 [Ustulina deusta]